MLNPFQPSVAFHIETSHLICNVILTIGFYMRCNTGLKWIKLFKFWFQFSKNETLMLMNSGVSEIRDGDDI